MEIAQLVPGKKVLLEDGSVAEVIGAAAKAGFVRVRVTEAPFDASLQGQEIECSDYDIMAFAEGEVMDSSGRV